jgi:uncharacterized RDD family membrane protein YckC
MGQEWYYVVGGAQQGPVPEAQLRALIAQGQVGGGDLVWTDGMAEWQPAGSVPAFSAGGAPRQGFVPPMQQPAPGYYAPQPGATLGYQTPQRYYGAPAYAGFWLRFCAVFIDGIVLWVIQLPIDLALGTGDWVDDPHPGAAAVSALLSIVIGWLYEALQTSSSHQATLGKRAVGIVVTDLNGQRIGFGQATGRHFAKILSALILLIGFIMAAFTQRKQALHDMIASTLVVKK